MATVLLILFIILEVLILALGALYGYRRGTGKSVVRIIYVTLLAVVSFFIARVISAAVAGGVLAVVISVAGGKPAEIMATAPEIKEAVRAILAAAIAPSLFALFFGILQALSMFKFDIVSKKLIMLVRKNGDLMKKGSRWGGAAIGLAQGVIVATILLIPLTCAITILGDTDPAALAALKIPGYSETGESSSAHSSPSNTLMLYTNMVHPLTQYYNKLPIQYVAKKITKINQNIASPQAANLIIVAPQILSVAGNIANEVSAADDNGISKDTAISKAIELSCPNMEKSEYLKALLNQLFKSAGKTWEKGATYAGIKLRSENEISKAMINSLIEKFGKSKPEYATQTLKSLASANYASDGVLLDALTKDTFSFKDDAILNKVADGLCVLQKSETTKSIVENVGKLGSTLMLEAGITTIPANRREVYERYKNELVASVKSTDPYDDRALAKKIIEIAASYNYIILPGQARALAVALLSYFESVDNITVEGVMHYFGVTYS